MILVINICLNKLNEFEFVKPIENILKKSGTKFFTKHYFNVNFNDLSKAEKIIICGTALMDFNYLKNIKKFEWLKKSKKPVFGICGGAQIIASVFGNNLTETTKIGQFNVKATKKNKILSKKEFNSYFLNSKTPKIRKDFEVIARTGKLACMFKHKKRKLFGCLFHPEVLNPEIILNFCSN